MEEIEIAVEVDLTDGGCYQAYIKKITEEGVLVRFHENLKPDQLIKFQKVRLPPAAVKPCDPNYKEGDIIQVYSKPVGDVLDGWWKATVKLFKDDRCYVQFIDRQGEDLVQKDKIRQFSRLDCFKKLTVKVPHHLTEICEDDGVHTEFIQRTGVLAVIYSPSKSALVVVSANETIHKKAQMMSDIHIKALNDKLKIKQEMARCKESFTVEPKLIGHVIGAGGSNIKKAQQIPGIVYIKNNRAGTFHLCGETAEAVKKARGMLEFKSEEFIVPQKFAGKIIGKYGKNIDDIMSKSLVHKIIVIGDREAKDDDVSLEIIGTVDALENAKLLLNYQLVELRALEDSTPNLIPPTMNQNVIDCSSDKSQLEAGAELYNVHINIQTGISLGISVTTQKETFNRGVYKCIVICGVTKDSPAAKAGVRVGDKLISVNGHSLDGAHQHEVTDLIRSCTKHISMVLSRERVIGPGNENEHENLDNPSVWNKDHSIPRTNFHSQKPFQQYRDRDYGRQTGSRGGRGYRGRGGRGGRVRRGRGANNGMQEFQEPSMTCVGNTKLDITDEETGYIHLTNDPCSESSLKEGATNHERQKHGVESTSRNSMEDVTSSHSSKGKQKIQVKDRSTRSRIKKGELRLPSPDIILEPPIKGHSNYKVKMDLDRPVYTAAQKEEQNFKRDTTAKFEDSLVGEIKPEHFTAKADLCSKEAIGSYSMGAGTRGTRRRHTRGHQGRRMNHEQASFTSKFDEDYYSGSDNHDLTEEQDDDIPISLDKQPVLLAETHLNESFAKFNSLLKDEPTETKEMKEQREKEEALDRIDELEVLKFLVQTFAGGCSFGIFVCTAYSFFTGVNIEDWFSKRSKRFHIYRSESANVYLAPFFRELNICKHYFNPSKASNCDKTNCSYFHICRNFVRGNCRRRYCSLPHDLNSPENIKLKEMHGLQDFNDNDIIVLLNWKFPRLCHDYMYKKEGCQEAESKDEECPYLHYCKDFFFGKCKNENHCKFKHSFQDQHNSWVLRSCHLYNQSEEELKKKVYVPPPKERPEHSKESNEKHDESIVDWECAQTIKPENNSISYGMMFDPLKYSTLVDNGTNRSSGQRSSEIGVLNSVSQGTSTSAANNTSAQNILSTIHKPKYGHQESRSKLIGSEDSSEMDESLLSDAAAMKCICLSLTKRDCLNPTCQDLHLQHGVPYLWQIKLNGKWTSFLSNQNFQIEDAYCNLEDKIVIKDVVYDDYIYSIEVNFVKRDQDMYAILQGNTMLINTNPAIIRRLSTASFGDQTLNVDSYLTQWRWYWKDDNDEWTEYDSELQVYTLEVKFLKKQKTYLFSRKNYQLKYCLSFNDMEQTNLEYLTRRDILRRPLFVSEYNLKKKIHPERIVSASIEIFGEESKPSHFHPWDLANEFELVELDVTEGSEYTEVLNSFQETMRHRKYIVKFIYRVQSRKLWLEYQTKKKHMQADAEKDKLSRNAIDERNLFHGTDTFDTCRGICINNFDFRKSGKNATVYGQGSYFARDAQYSHGYTKPSSSGDRYMFRAKVLVGKFTRGSSDYRRPPEISGESHKLYDSCVDDPVNPSIFVIFDRNQCYPEYLINYSKDIDDMTISVNVGLPSSLHQSRSHRYVTQPNINTASPNQNSFTPSASSTTNYPVPSAQRSSISSSSVYQPTTPSSRTSSSTIYQPTSTTPSCSTSSFTIYRPTSAILSSRTSSSTIYQPTSTTPSCSTSSSAIYQPTSTTQSSMTSPSTIYQHASATPSFRTSSLTTPNLRISSSSMNQPSLSSSQRTVSSHPSMHSTRSPHSFSNTASTMGSSSNRECTIL